MALKHISLADFYLGWLLLFTLLFGTIAFFKAPNNLMSIAQYVAAATGAAAFAAAVFAVPVWLIAHFVSP